ncbi:MAG: PorT family protein, partial [Bacteroidota bacterium]|nr:PorT family protein [Bacteroidota bacterium]
MNKIVFLYLFWLLPMVVISQAESEVALDSLYREDQIYIGVTYNTFIQAPESLSQTNFSPGFKVGLIRDFPIN